VKQAVVEIKDLNSVVLTYEGKVVGFVDVHANQETSIDFVGRAVNIQNYAMYRDFTNHGFACGMAIRTDDANEVANVENFNKALAEVSK
jgi:hypothetical protein